MIGESAHSKKTRIETCMTYTHVNYNKKVKAPIPRKQGLKQNWKLLLNQLKTCESAHSKKTRIETCIYPYMFFLSHCGESAHSKKTRIETSLGDKRSYERTAGESAHSKKTRIETLRNLLFQIKSPL